MGEDIPGFGPNRGADSPSIAHRAPVDGRPARIRITRAACSASSWRLHKAQRANPISVVVLPWVLIGNQLAILPTDDTGGVHVNATILSHAFYLAIEGGRNATSGVTVQGVGAANRAQIERAFFRAMTLAMPNVPTMQTAAQATFQAAVDLDGANSTAAVAVRQAMQAVGLLT